MENKNYDNSNLLEFNDISNKLKSFRLDNLVIITGKSNIIITIF